MALSARTRLGPYEILSALGAGGMGEVYRARDTKLNRDVALKLLPESFVDDPDRVARFRREAQVLASLNHPHIAAIYGLEEANGSQFLILELVEGETLAQRLTSGPLPVDEALTVARQIADALEAAHEKGIIHRDLKPANIAFTADGQVKVLDFGLAKALDPVMGSDLTNSPTLTLATTQAGIILGTAAYMSPEQARGKAADKRADIWAFGVVLYEMLTGHAAFTHDTIADTIAAILNREPEWAPLPKTTPPSMLRLLRRCLDKDPRQRLHDIADARIEVDEARREPESVARPTEIGNRATRERLAWTLLAGALIICAVLAVPATLYVRRATPPAATVTRFDVMTPQTTDAFSFAISPDGRQLAFVATAEGAQRLWIRSLGQAVGHPLAGTEGAQAPFWAPDSRRLGFFAEGKLEWIDVAGGAPQVLADAPTARGGSWSGEDVIVFASTAIGGLKRVAATGGRVTPATQATVAQGSQRWPYFLPDNRHFLFLVTLGSPDAQGIYVGSLDGDAPKRLLSSETAAAYAPGGHLLFASQGALIARRFDLTHLTIIGEPITVADGLGLNTGLLGQQNFSVSGAGVLTYRGGAGARRQLIWADRTGKMLGVLRAPDDAGLSSANLAPDGKAAVVTRAVQGNPDVWLIDATRSTLTRFTSDPSIDDGAVWAPNGEAIAFDSSRSGKFDLFRKPADGSADEEPLLTNAQD